MTFSPITISDQTPTLANGWEWVPLGDVARLATGHTPDRSIDSYWNGGIPWISLTEIRDLDGRVADSTELTVTADGIRHSSSVLLPPGTVCLSRTASIGFVTVTGTEMATSQDFVNWVCGPRLDPMYLMRALIASRQNLRALSTGSTHKTLYMRVAEKFRVLLPPIEEQRRIATILGKADGLRAKRRATLAQLDSLAHSIFLDMFGDPAASSADLPTARIGQLSTVTSGSTPRRDRADFYGGGIPWVKTAEIPSGNVIATEESLTKLGLRESACRLFPPGSVLVALYGQGKTRGSAALLSIEAATNQACGVILPSSSFRPLFLLWQLKMSYERLRSLGRGGNQENLNLGHLRDFVVLVPALDRQDAFVERIDAVTDARTRAQACLNEQHKLFASLQHHAFSGSL